METWFLYASLGIHLLTGQQIAHVGNIAWAHLCALKALCENPWQVGGEAYYVTDDTPEGSFTSMYESFVNAVGYKYASYCVPYLLVFLFFTILRIVFLILKPVVYLNIPSAPENIRLCTMYLTFSRKKLERLCGYQPLYSYQESLNNLLPITKISNLSLVRVRSHWATNIAIKFATKNEMGLIPIFAT